MSKTHPIPKLNSVEWKAINWRKVELATFKLQKRIYQASKNDNVRKLRRLQKTLLNSYYAKLLAVRRISQDNAGKKTAGVDGVKSLTPKQRLKLASVIIGWSNYYQTVCSKETYSKIGNLLFWKLYRWGHRRHSNKSKTWINNKYWRTIGMNNWRFACKIGDIEYVLPMHSETKIIRHVKVIGDTSPYDGNSNYWASRMGKHPEVKSSVARLLKKQKGICNQCGLTFRNEDIIERDHITPRQAGGSKIKDNLQLLHKHCHDVKTKTDLVTIKHYKFRQGWAKVYKRFQLQFESSNWIWDNDLPTLV